MKFMNVKFHALLTIEFHRRYTTISILVWLASLAFSLIWVFLSAWLFFLITFITTSVILLVNLQRYEKFLNSRISSKSGIIWDVSVNGVKVGCIPDWAYAHILKRALFDPVTWFLEFSNLLSYFKSILLEIFLGIPALAFWVILSLFIFFPDKLIKIKIFSIDQINHSINLYQISSIVIYIMISFIVRIVFVILSKSRFGMFEYLNLNISSRVKGFVKFAGDGTISVYIFQNGNYITAKRYRNI